MKKLFLIYLISTNCQALEIEVMSESINANNIKIIVAKNTSSESINFIPKESIFVGNIKTKYGVVIFWNKVILPDGTNISIESKNLYSIYSKNINNQNNTESVEIPIGSKFSVYNSNEYKVFPFAGTI